MTSVKSLLDAQCGAQAPLVSLSKNYGQSNSSNLLPNRMFSQSDLLIQEYLRNVAAETSAPSTFDMSALLRQCQPSSSNINQDNKMQTKQRNDVNLALLEKWTSEYRGRVQSASAQSNNAAEWANAYLQSQGSSAMTDAWLQSIHPLAVTASLGSTAAQQPQSQGWASDYLEKFDTVAVRNDGGTTAPLEAGDVTDSAANAWMDEYLRRYPATTTENMDYKDLNDDAFEIFSRYENAWRDAEWANTSGEKYAFRSENAFANESEPLAKAHEFFSQGNLSDAVLCYEAALQRNPTDAETWCSLGLCHAENEQDGEAIAAFQRSLELEPLSRRTLLASAVSLANEGLDTSAMRHLDQWIAQYTSGETTGSKAFVDDAFVVDESWIHRLEEKFLDAVLNLKTEDSSIAAELHNALGIFYNLTQNYEKAVEAIRAAISLTPEDPVLWNRLGASLANSDRSPEAIGAYRKALSLFPAYVRARYNLGVSCINMSAYRDAIGHFLSALRLQKSRQNAQIWTKLRSCVIRTSNFSSNSNPLASTQWITSALDAIEARDVETMTRIYKSSTAQ